MPRTLHRNPNIILTSPLQRLAHLLRRCRIDHVYWIVTILAPSITSVHIAIDTGSIRPNGIAGVVRPDRVVDAYRVVCMPC